MNTSKFLIKTDLKSLIVKEGAIGNFSLIKEGGAPSGMDKKNQLWCSKGVKIIGFSQIPDIQTASNTDIFTMTFDTKGYYRIECTNITTAEPYCIRITVLSEQDYSDLHWVSVRNKTSPASITKKTSIFKQIIETLPNSGSLASKEAINLISSWHNNLAEATSTIPEGDFFEVAASYLPANNVVPLRLNVSMHNSKGSWCILDLSAPGHSTLCKYYDFSSSSATPFEEALQRWARESKYPDGTITFSGLDPTTNNMISGEIKKSGATIGKYDSVYTDIKSWNELCDVIDEATKANTRSLNSITWTTLHGYNSSIIPTGASPNQGSNEYDIGTPNNSALTIAGILSGSSALNTKWSQGATVFGYTGNSEDCGVFCGIASYYAQGVICSFSVLQDLQRFCQDQTKSSLQSFFDALKSTMHILESKELLVVDIIPRIGFEKDLQRLGDKSEVIHLNSPIAITGHSKKSNSITKIAPAAVLTGASFGKAWDKTRIVGPRAYVTINQYTFDEAFKNHGFLPAQKINYASPQAASSDIPSHHWVYLFQCEQESPPALLEKMAGSSGPALIDTGKHLFAFISPVELNEEQLSVYSSNSNHLRARSMHWSPSQLQDQLRGSSKSELYLVNYYDQVTELAGRFKCIRSEIDTLSNCSRNRLANISDAVGRVSTDLPRKVAIDFSKLSRFSIQAPSRISELQIEQEKYLDALYKSKHTSQWVLMTKDIEGVLGEDVRLEYWQSTSHPEETEYLATFCDSIESLDPDSAVVNAYKTMTWIKVFNKATKSSKFHEALRLFTINRLIKGATNGLDLKSIARRDAMYVVGKSIDFKSANSSIARQIDKMILESGSSSGVLADKKRSNYIASLKDNKIQKLSPSPAKITPGKDLQLRLTPKEGFEAKYRKLQKAELIFGQIALGVEVASLIVTGLYCRDLYAKGELKSKHVAAFVEASLNVAKEAGSLFATVCKHDPDFAANFPGRRALQAIGARTSVSELAASPFKFIKKATALIGVAAGIAATTKGVTTLLGASNAYDKNNAVADILNGGIGVGVAAIDVFAEFGATWALIEIRGASLGLIGAAVAVFVGAGVAIFKYTNEDALRNWPKRANADLEHLNWETNHIETLDESQKFDAEIQHLLKLAIPAQIQITSNTLTYSSSEGTLKIVLDIGPMVSEQANIILSKFTFADRSLQSGVAEVFGVDPGLFDDPNHFVSIPVNLMKNGAITLEKFFPTTVFDYRPYSCEMIIDLAGDATQLFPAEPIKISAMVENPMLAFARPLPRSNLDLHQGSR